MSMRRFRLININNQAPICDLEMDDELLKPEAGIINQDNFTLDAFRGGTMYTLIPYEDDHTTVVLNKIKTAYDNIVKKPTNLLSTTMNRIDLLIETVGLLFGEIEYYLIENADDMDALINPHKNYDHKKIKYSILESVLPQNNQHTHDGSCCTKH